MAGELVIPTFNITYSKANNGAITIATKAISATVTGGGFHDNVQSVGTADEAVLLGDMTVGGWMYCENFDATNFCSVRGATLDEALVQMLATEMACFRLSPAATPTAIADTAGVLVRFCLFDL